MAILGGLEDLSEYLAYTSGYRTCENKFLSVLDSIVWYNGIGEIVLQWKDKEPNISGYISPDYFDKDYDVETKSDLEFIWMVAVLLFGDYGTSPRSGWIRDISEFKNFIMAITKTYRESEGER